MAFGADATIRPSTAASAVATALIRRERHDDVPMFASRVYRTDSLGPGDTGKFLIARRTRLKSAWTTPGFEDRSGRASRVVTAKAPASASWGKPRIRKSPVSVSCRSGTNSEFAAHPIFNKGRAMKTAHRTPLHRRHLADSEIVVSPTAAFVAFGASAAFATRPAVTPNPVAPGGQTSIVALPGCTSDGF